MTPDSCEAFISLLHYDLYTGIHRMSAKNVSGSKGVRIAKVLQVICYSLTSGICSSGIYNHRKQEYLFHLIHLSSQEHELLILIIQTYTHSACSDVALRRQGQLLYQDRGPLERSDCAILCVSRRWVSHDHGTPAAHRSKQPSIHLVEIIVSSELVSAYG